jgi:hypothetical protein
VSTAVEGYPCLRPRQIQQARDEHSVARAKTVEVGGDANDEGVEGPPALLPRRAHAMALSYTAECALSLACARWVARRLSLSGANDSASWPAASPGSFAPVPRACRAAPRSPPTTTTSSWGRCPRCRSARRTASSTTALAGRWRSPCAAWASRGQRTTAASSTPTLTTKLGGVQESLRELVVYLSDVEENAC